MLTLNYDDDTWLYLPQLVFIKILPNMLSILQGRTYLLQLLQTPLLKSLLKH